MDNSNQKLRAIENLLDQIRILSKKKKELIEERLIRGEYFNIFQDLGLISDEVHLHSSIIATLLNTKGSHGQNDKYLKAFVEMLCRLDKNTPIDFIDTKNKKISVHHIDRYQQYNGDYLLYRKRECYIREDKTFVMSSMINLRKVENISSVEITKL